LSVGPAIVSNLPKLNPRIVVTGAAGFIGSRLLLGLAGQHPAAELLAVDHPLTAAKRDNLRGLSDIPFLDHRALLAALEADAIRPELIYHIGACSSTTETNWDYLAENNLAYSRRIWTWCASRQSRLIYASSAATYGDGRHGFDDELDLDRLQPLNLYAKSKHDFDLWARDEIRSGRPVPPQQAGFKFFNVFGPGEAHKGRMASMVFHGWNQIREHGSVKLFQSHRADYADGGQLRDFIGVDDVVRVLLATAAQPTVSGLFNLGTGRAHSFRELIEALFAALGRAPRIEYILMPEDLRDKYQYFTEARMGKLAKAGVPFTPTRLGTAVAAYVGWLAGLTNPGVAAQGWRPAAQHDKFYVR
jgi:ADP-L-glycero-D-manno-heptose 6-epimerase